MDLMKEIDKALGYLKKQIANEAATCHLVIDPLLHAAGYELEDYLPEGRDAGGKLPDYTLLPKDDHEFYLEAKASKESLETCHANQALDYANHNGKRWVALTNGWEWHLYDNSVMGKADAKLAARAELKNIGSREVSTSHRQGVRVLGWVVQVRDGGDRGTQETGGAGTPPGSGIRSTGNSGWHHREGTVATG